MNDIKLNTNERKLVAALRDAMVQRDKAKADTARIGDKLVKVQDEVTVLNDALCIGRRELAECKQLYSAAVDYSVQLEVQRDAARNEAATATSRADQLRAEIETLREVIGGYELAVTCLHGEEAVEKIKKSMLPDVEDIPTVTEDDALKFLFRMACRGAHPDHGGTAELFKRVKDSFTELKSWQTPERSNA